MESDAGWLTVSAVRLCSGIGRDFDNAWRGIVEVLDLSNTILLAPNFYLSSDTPTRQADGTLSNWYDPFRNLAWLDFVGWTGGHDPVAPVGLLTGAEGSHCSTYAVYDSLLSALENRATYPNLRHIYLAGHSGGAAFMDRYALVQGPPHDAARDDRTLPSSGRSSLRFVIGNPPSAPYFTADRTNMQPDCPDFDNWPFDVRHPDPPVPAANTSDNVMPRYVRAKLNPNGHLPVDAAGLLARYLSRDVVTLQGDMDTRARYPQGDYACGVLSQGGDNRRDRTYAYWAYKVLVSGGMSEGSIASQAETVRGGPDPRSFWGYDILNKTVRPLITPSPFLSSTLRPAFRHSMCVIAGVGHTDTPLFGSACGRAAFTPAGFSPSMSAPPARP